MREIDPDDSRQFQQYVRYIRIHTRQLRLAQFLPKAVAVREIEPALRDKLPGRVSVWKNTRP